MGRSKLSIFDDVSELLVNLKKHIRAHRRELEWFGFERISEQHITEIDQMLQRIAAQPKKKP